MTRTITRRVPDPTALAALLAACRAVGLSDADTATELELARSGTASDVAHRAALLAGRADLADRPEVPAPVPDGAGVLRRGQWRGVPCATGVDVGRLSARIPGPADGRPRDALRVIHTAARDAARDAHRADRGKRAKPRGRGRWHPGGGYSAE
jgi:hypothetical protein